MAYKGRKIANSFYLPKHSIVRGLASLMDFAFCESREFTDELLARSDADASRADWEAVGTSLWWALDQHAKHETDGSEV